MRYKNHISVIILIYLVYPTKGIAECETHGVWHKDTYCWGVPNVPAPTPKSPSPEELEEQADRQDEAEAADDYNSKAVNAYKNGHYLEAVKYLKKAIEIQPDNDLYKKNLNNAMNKLQESISHDENLRIQERDKTFAKKYSKIPSVPTPSRSTYVQYNIHGIDVLLSPKAKIAFEVIQTELKKLPHEFGDEFIDKLLNNLPSKNAKKIWNFDKGLIDDIHKMFESIKSDLRNHGQLDSDAERSLRDIEISTEIRLVKLLK